MSEQEVVIKISAKNLTSEEFAKARREITGLSDASGKASKDGAAGWSVLVSSIKDVGAMAFKASALMAAAIGTVSAAIVALGQRGADVADVRDQFDVLNATIGNTGKDVLPVLRAAVAGTISDFDLMKSANLGLSQGLKLSSQDFELVGKASRVLADRVGGDAKTAFDTLVTAMASGKDMALKSIGANIDATAAVNAYAKSLGLQASELNETQQKAAKQSAIMAELNRIMLESGEASVDFADRIAQAKIALSNFTDQLGEGIARSPVLAAGMDAIADAFDAAFGDKSQGLVKGSVHLIERIAIVMADVAQIGVLVARSVTRSWSGLELIFAGTASVVDSIALALIRLVETAATIAQKIPGVGHQFDGVAQEAKIMGDIVAKTQKDFHDQAAAAWEGVKGNSEFEKTLDKVSGVIDTVKTRMMEATAASEQHVTATRHSTTAQIENTAALEKRASALKKIQEADHANTWNGTQLPDFQKVLGRKGENPLMEQVNSSPIDWERMLGITTTPTELAPKMRHFGQEIVKDLPGTILSAVQGGGNPIAAAGSMAGGKIGEKLVGKFGGVITEQFGKTLGAGINAILPGVGAMVGPLIGKLGGVIKNLFSTAGRDSVRDFASSMGGFDELHTKLGALGAEGEKLWVSLTQGVGRGNAAQAKAAIEQVNKALGAFEGKLKDARTAEETLAGRLGELSSISPAVQEALARVYDASNPEAYLAAIQEVNGALDADAAKQKEVDDLLKKYNLSWTELGASAKAARVAETTKDIAHEFDVLRGAGVDVNHIMEKMGPHVNDFVKDAQKAGVEIPESFRRIIQTAMDSGQILDANGNEIKDMSSLGLTFGQTMQETTKSVATAVEHLAEVLENSLGGAFDRTGQRADHAFRDRTIHVNTEMDGGSEPPSFATEAFVRKPTLAMIGDTPGGEYVLKPKTIQNLVNSHVLAGIEQGRREGAAPAAPIVDLDPLKHELVMMRRQMAGMAKELARSVQAGAQTAA